MSTGKLTDDAPCMLVVDVSAGLDAEPELVPLAGDELEELQARQQQAVVEAASAARIADDREQLVAALEAGKATPEQVQAALARVLQGQ